MARHNHTAKLAVPLLSHPAGRGDLRIAQAHEEPMASGFTSIHWPNMGDAGSSRRSIKKAAELAVGGPWITESNPLERANYGLVTFRRPKSLPPTALVSGMRISIESGSAAFSLTSTGARSFQSVRLVLHWPVWVVSASDASLRS